MAMEEEVRALLLAAAGCPVAWGAHPADTGLPRVTLTRVSGLAGLTLDGDDGLRQGRVQADCFGVPGPDLDAVEAAVKTALHAYQGGAVLSAQLLAIRDLTEADAGDLIQRVSLDFAVLYRE